MKENRKFLKFLNMEDYEKVVPVTDSRKNMQQVPYQKEYPENSDLINLISPEDLKIGHESFLKLVNERKSRRKFTDNVVSIEELSFLLWSTQGVKKVNGNSVIRTVPSSGGQSPFETYLVINRVEGLKPGLYRYISFSHKLLFVKSIDNSEKTMGELSYDQKFVGDGAVIFCWVAIPYRTEYFYSILSHKFIAIDLGMICQNLYMACEAIKLGTVAIGYYQQEKIDTLFELDGENEFVVLLAPVGKKD